MTLPLPATIEAHEVHVVHFRLDEIPAAARTNMPDRAEHTRAERFVLQRDRRRFLTARIVLRAVLGQLLDRRPEHIRFTTTPHGKLNLADDAFDLRFNISHSGERAVLAVALGREVGVDIEENRPIDTLRLARRFLAAGEIRALEETCALDRTTAFFRCWTRKEAFVKAIGTGLSYPLDAFEVSVAGDGPQLLRTCARDPDATRQWRIVSLPTERTHAAALAAGGLTWDVMHWTL
jgi:4'-phosphopantetheinyl transferase